MHSNTLPTSEPTSSSAKEEIARLRQQLQKAETAYVAAVMEKNFLQRAMADFNFHQNSNDGIVYTDAHNHVVYANLYFLQMMKIDDVTEIINNPLPDYMWFDRADEERLFADVRSNGFVRDRELLLYNRDRQPVFTLCSSVVSKDEEGKFLGTEILLSQYESSHKVEIMLLDQTKTLRQAIDFCRAGLRKMTERIGQGVTTEEMVTLINELTNEMDRRIA